MNSPNPGLDKENENDKEKDNDDPSNPDSFWLQVGRYSQLAFVLPAALVVGWLIGAALDKWLHTTWLYLAGILLGITAGFVELIRTVTRDTK
ncbi:MAG TPA: AtpZ/AtpI family protein [Candidatus Sulfotelmatobacter sp.]